MDSKFALITGASGGIGEALAHQFAADDIPLILVARKTKELERVKSEIVKKYSVKVHVRSVDLSEQTAAEELYKWTTSEKLTVAYLVNNAGFGDKAPVTSADTAKMQSMIRLNVESLTTLSKLYAADMKKAKKGNIVNIASIAAFIPGPGMAVYFATKSYVLSFSQALAAELEKSGVKVTTICPGPTKTGFSSAAKADKSDMFSGKLPTADDVAVFTYKAMKQGKLVATWGFGTRIATRFVSLAPRWPMLRAIRKKQM